VKVEVDQELCISCGSCIDLCPEVFDWNDENKAQAVDEEVPSELEEEVKNAIEDCPTDAISEI